MIIRGTSEFASTNDRLASLVSHKKLVYSIPSLCYFDIRLTNTVFKIKGKNTTLLTFKKRRKQRKNVYSWVRNENLV